MIDKEKLEMTLRLWNATIEEIERMAEFIVVDKLNDQFYRRIFLRNIFSIIETYLFITKEIIKIKISFQDNLIQLSSAEMLVLSEKKASLDKQGNVVVKDEFQSFEPSLRFTFTTFATVFGSTSPNFGDINFQKLIMLAKRRNQITHPKCAIDLVITDEEIKSTFAMFSWFIHTHGNLSQKCIQWFKDVYN